MANTKLLVSLAMLQVNWEKKHHDLLDNFIPFVKECIKITDSKEISSDLINTCLKENFGLEIPIPVIKTMLSRLYKLGFLNPFHGVYVVNKDKFRYSGKSFIKERASFDKKLSILVEKFVDFVYKNFQDKSFTKKTARNLLWAYIDSRGFAILESILTENKFKVKVSPKRKHAYYLGKFIESLLDSDDLLLLEYLEQIIKGSMIFSLIYSQDYINTNLHKFKNLSIFLDTPVLLKILGYKGEIAQQYGLQLIDLLKEEKAHLKIFDKTLWELERVLWAAKQELAGSTNPYQFDGDVIRTLLKKKYTANKLQQEIDLLEHTLESLNIYVYRLPNFIKSEKKIDEVKLKNLLDSTVHYRNQEALEHDLDCLLGVFRLRNGKKMVSLERSCAIFLTDNTKVVQASRKFFKDFGVPLCYLDHIIASLAWVKQPKKAPDLPRIQIMADCFTLLNPSDELWSKYLKKIDEYKAKDKISEEEYILLKYSSFAEKALMEVTHGDASAFSEGTINEILDKAKEDIINQEKIKQTKIIKQLEIEKNREYIEKNREYTKRIQIEERYKTLLNIFEHSIRYILFGALVFLSYIFIPKQPIKFYKLSLRVLGYSFTQILAIIINLFGKDAINHFIEVIITRMKIDKRGHKNEI